MKSVENQHKNKELIWTPLFVMLCYIVEGNIGYYRLTKLQLPPGPEQKRFRPELAFLGDKKYVDSF
jgi:hypothetical protein